MPGPMDPAEVVRKSALLLAALEAGLAPTKVLGLMVEWGLLDPELMRPRSPRVKSGRARRRARQPWRC